MVSRAPGLYHEESFAANGAIAGDDTSVVGFLGATQWGPVATPTKLVSFSEFLKYFGPYQLLSDTAYAVKGFFDNGGGTCYVSRQVHYSDVTTGATTAAAAGLDVADQASSPAKIMDVDAKYVGSYGNDIAVAVTLNPKVSTTLAANVNFGASTIVVTSPMGIYPGQVLSLDSGAEFVKVASVATTVSGGVPTHTVTLTATIGTAGTPAFVSTDPVVSLEFDLEVYYEDSIDPAETWSQVNLESGIDGNIEDLVNNVDTGSNYIEVTIATANALYAAGYGTPAVLKTYYPTTLARTSMSSGASGGTIDATDLAGSSVTGVGVHAYDSIDDVRILAMIPDSAEASWEPGPIHEALSLAATRRDLFVICEVDQDETPTTALTTRSADGFNSKFGAIYYNRIQIVDPLTGLSRYISPLGHVAGRFARADSVRGRGPWDSPAGTERGLLVGAIGVEQTTSSTQAAALNDAGINLIRMYNRRPVVFGARTLIGNDLVFRYINTTRTLMYLQKSIDTSLSWAAFENNDNALWDRVRERIRTFLARAWGDGALKGTTPDDAFEVLVGESDGVQTGTDTDNGRMIAQIGVALQRPAEYVIFRWSELSQR